MSGSFTTPTSPTGPEPAVSPAAGVEFVRIGLAGRAGRADLAVPAGVPLARLLPMLLRQAGEDPGPDGGARHGGWILRRPDGTRLDPATSLTDQGIQEGDLLFLGHGTDDTTPPLYDDVVEVIGDHAITHPWPTTATRHGAAALATLAALTACAALATAPGHTLAAWLALAVAVLMLGAGVLMSRAFGDIPAGTLTAVLAVPAAVVGAVKLLDGDELTAGHLLLACAVVAVVGVLGPVLIGGGDGTFVALVVAGPLAASGTAVCAIWDDTTPAQGAAITAPLALALTTLWPTLALRVARIPPPHLAATTEELEHLPSQLAHDHLTARITAARHMLTGMQTGSHLTAATATLILFSTTELWAGVLGGTLTMLMLLRARLFRETQQVATAVTAALAATAGAAIFTVIDHTDQTTPLLGILLPTTLTTALIAGGTAIAAGRYRGNPRLARTLDILETLLLLAVVPLALAVWNVYGALLDWRA